MKATIKKVAIDVVSKSTGRVVNLITLSNDTVIVRDTKQFDADLKGSGLKKRKFTDLFGGAVDGDFKYHKKNQKYVTDEYIDKDGNTVPSREGTYESDGYRVEGFLMLEVSERAAERQANAEAYAEMKLDLQKAMGMFGDTNVYAIEPTIVEPELIPTA